MNKDRIRGNSSSLIITRLFTFAEYEKNVMYSECLWLRYITQFVHSLSGIVHDTNSVRRLRIMLDRVAVPWILKYFFFQKVTIKLFNLIFSQYPILICVVFSFPPFLLQGYFCCHCQILEQTKAKKLRYISSHLDTVICMKFHIWNVRIAILSVNEIHQLWEKLWLCFGPTYKKN